MGEPYIFPIFILILNIYLIIILKLKRMVYLKSLQKLESKNTQVFIYYCTNRMKITFKKNRENGRIFHFSVNGEILLKHKLIYGNRGTGIKIKPLNINLGGRFFTFLEIDTDRTLFTIIKKNLKNEILINYFMNYIHY